VLLTGLSACTSPGKRDATAEAIRHEMDAAVQEKAKAKKSEAVNNALMPPLTISLPEMDNKLPEPRFDLAVNNTPASQVFTAIVSGTRYSMLVTPEVRGDITLNLKDVTVLEALDAIRELYGYEYKIEGSRIYIQSTSMQTRIYQVNYLTGERVGESSLTVKSSDNITTTTKGTTTAPAPSPASGQNSSSSIITKSTSKDFWSELEDSIKAILGGEKGRTVKINPMSGIIVVRAMPDELRNIAAYLKASQLAIERQVILEAKIVDVQLNDSSQSGVNWAGFGNLKGSNGKGSYGVVSPGTSIQTLNSADGTAQTLSSKLLTATPGAALSAVSGATGAMFGLAFQSNNFAALLNFLDSQGDVHVLSSPRIATLNNQKAVLKVGTDEYFATGFTTTAAVYSNGVLTAPASTTPDYSMFFSGIALDVTPRIDENGEVILHVHPSVSNVSTVDKLAIIGTTGSTGMVPLASSTISETDSIVRAHDGQIVVIGGLINQQSANDQSGMPGLPKSIFGQTSKVNRKRELVILLKPTVVDAERDWSQDITRSRDRINSISR
jgi:MSHA biogenesis protein MshL